MRLLFITPRFPFPPVKGDRLRALHFIKELSKKHSIHLLSFIESPGEKENIKILERYCKAIDVIYLPRWQSVLKMVANISLSEAFQIVYYKSKKMREMIKTLVERNKYDIIHINLIRMAPYIDCFDGIPVVIDHIDSLSMNMERRYKTENGLLRKIMFRKEWKSMKDCEYKYRAVPSIVTSEKDKDALYSYNNVKVIANGVDLNNYKFIDNDKTGKDIDLLFVGNLGYYPNAQAVEYFFEKIYPILKESRNELKIYIVGPNCNKKISAFSNNRNVFIPGFVDDVREYYYRAKLFIAPMQSGTGIQNKILESMACGVPVVSTSLGNAAIKAIDKKEIVIANKPDHFSGKAIRFLEDKKMRRKISFNARKFVEANFSWEKKVREMGFFYKEVFSGFSKRCNKL